MCMSIILSNNCVLTSFVLIYMFLMCITIIISTSFCITAEEQKRTIIRNIILIPNVTMLWYQYHFFVIMVLLTCILFHKVCSSTQIFVLVIQLRSRRGSRWSSIGIGKLLLNLLLFVTTNYYYHHYHHCYYVLFITMCYYLLLLTFYLSLPRSRRGSRPSKNISE